MFGSSPEIIIMCGLKLQFNIIFIMLPYIQRERERERERERARERERVRESERERERESQRESERIT